MRFQKLQKILGPGLLMAGAAIGTSHLVLSTRAGAHHGLVFIWIILIALLLKYPAFEFGPRYAVATGQSLLRAYQRQGRWAIGLFTVIVFINMFTVTAAIGATTAGLLSSIFQVALPMQSLVFVVLAGTALVLMVGRYRLLDQLIKLITVVLVFAVLIALVSVLIHGPADVAPDEFVHGPSLWQGAGLALLVSLIGFMPAGMEGSTFNSIWTVVKIRDTGYHPTMKEGLMDFNIGYALATVTALIFLVIGAFTVYGTGTLLEGNPTVFSNKLIAVFTTKLGSWASPVMAICAFGAIFGTLITIMDAFPRTFVHCLRIYRFANLVDDDQQLSFLRRNYLTMLLGVMAGAYIIFYYFGTSLVTLLYIATIISFLTSPVIAILNHRAVHSSEISAAYRPKPWLSVLSVVGICFLALFGLYYLADQLW